MSNSHTNELGEGISQPKTKLELSIQEKVSLASEYLSTFRFRILKTSVVAETFQFDVELSSSTPTGNRKTVDHLIVIDDLDGIQKGARDVVKLSHIISEVRAVSAWEWIIRKEPMNLASESHLRRSHLRECASIAGVTQAKFSEVVMRWNEIIDFDAIFEQSIRTALKALPNTLRD